MRDEEGNLVDDATVIMLVHVIGWQRLDYSAYAEVIWPLARNASLSTIRITSPPHMFLGLV